MEKGRKWRLACENGPWLKVASIISALIPLAGTQPLSVAVYSEIGKHILSVFLGEDMSMVKT